MKNYIKLVSVPVDRIGTTRFKLIGDPFSAGANVVGSLLSYFGNKSNTKATNDLTKEMFEKGNEFTHQENELAFQREYDAAKEFFNMENAYNSPLEQLKRYEEAGINPSVAFAGSLGSASSTPANASAPTGKSGSSVGVPSLQPFPQVPNLGQQGLQGMQAFSEVIKNLSNSKYMNAQTKATIDTLQASIKNIIARTDDEAASARLKNSQAEYQEFENVMQSIFGHEKAAKEVQKLGNEVMKLANEAAVAEALGNNYKAQEKYYDALEALTRSKDEEVRAGLPYIANYFKARINQTNASAADSWSHVGVNKAMEKQITSTTKLIDEEVRGLKNDNDIKEWTKTDRFNMVVEQARQCGIQGELLAQALIAAKRENNWGEMEKLIKNSTAILNSVPKPTMRPVSKTSQKWWSDDGSLRTYEQYNY